MKIIFFMLFLSMSSKAQLLTSARVNYLKAVEDKALCKKIISELENAQQDVLIGYLGAYQTLWANHAFSPIEKLATFKKGKNNLEKSIAMNPNLVETRVLRLSIQNNAPGFLGYKDKIDEDKAFINKYKSMVQNKEVQQLLEKVL